MNSDRKNTFNNQNLKLGKQLQDAQNEMTPEQWDRFNKINNKMIQSMSEMSTNMGSDLENLTKMNEDMDMDEDFDDDEDTDED